MIYGLGAKAGYNIDTQKPLEDTGRNVFSSSVVRQNMNTNPDFQAHWGRFVHGRYCVWIVRGMVNVTNIRELMGLLRLTGANISLGPQSLLTTTSAYLRIRLL
jgi:hypothetical protein